MKEQIRLLGVDDGSFSFTDKNTVIIGTVIRANGYLEGVLKRDILVDGLEATEVIIEMIHSTIHRKQLKAMLIDGVTVGGFNVIDIEEVFKETRLPIITITRDLPDFDRIKKALQAHFIDWDIRFNILKRGNIFEMETKYNPIYFKSRGISLEKAKEIIRLSTIRGVIPEPIRVAHLIASGIMRGESYGKT
jgi:endonuclease V-like protein UPF0215 family